MDIASLEEAIVLDIEKGHRPCLVIVSAGMSHIDDVVEVRRLCDLHNIWLHVEGEASSLLLCTFPPTSIRSILLCDSIIVRPSEWHYYQLLSTVVWTCFPSANKLESYNSFVSNYNAQNNLFSSLPLYLAMLRLGSGNLVEFMDHSVLLANHLRGLLGALPSIIVSLEDTLPIVTFRYAPASLSESENTTLLSRLNEQVLLDLSGMPQIHSLGLVLVHENGFMCISFRPFYLEDVLGIKTNLLESFVELLKVETSLIDATLNCRDCFAKEIAKLSGLELMDADDFVGLGAVRCVCRSLRNPPVSCGCH